MFTTSSCLTTTHANGSLMNVERGRSNISYRRSSRSTTASRCCSRPTRSPDRRRLRSLLRFPRSILGWLQAHSGYGRSGDGRLAVRLMPITQRDYPYVYGGGHAEAGVASIGMKGPGYNGRRVGLDCSGSVAAVLAAAGLWPAGGGVPSDAGIIATLRSERMIVRGVGRGPV